jgi:hypothetical protein
MNSVGIYYPVGKGKNRLRKSHSFGMFLIKKKNAKLLQQISDPHSREVAVGTILTGKRLPHLSSALAVSEL